MVGSDVYLGMECGSRQIGMARVIWRAATLLVTHTVCTASSAVPPFVSAVDQATVVRTAPTENPADWLLAIVEVETTGLVPGFHEMIDLGLVMTDLDGRVVDSRRAPFLSTRWS